MSRPLPEQAPDAAAGRGDAWAVELTGVCRRFGRVEANRDVDLRVAAGTVHALVGENGAGKSTLMRILAGMERADAGDVRILGTPLKPRTPARAIELGVGMVHQHFMLFDSLTVAENVIAGCEPTRRGLLDRLEARRSVAALAAEHGLDADPDARVGDLPVGMRQRVEILKVLYRGARVLVLDEPTAVLSPPEVEGLFRMVRAFADGGRTVILTTHRLDEVLSNTDRVTVMRGGRVAGDFDTRATTAGEIVRCMVGRDLAQPPSDAGRPQPGRTVLELRDACVDRDGVRVVDRVSLAVRQGEVLGIAGVQGNGQSELLEAIAGLRPFSAGTLLVDGADATRRSVADRRASGLACIPEDRNAQGLVPDLPVAENLVLGDVAAFRRPGWRAVLGVDPGLVRERARSLIGRFDLRPGDPDAPIRTLSGGNAQKALVAREVARGPVVLVAGQPTRGVDVGAIEAIHAEIRAVRDAGTAVLLVSADLAEVLALSDRVLVFARGRIAGEARAADATVAQLGAWMTGTGTGTGEQSHAKAQSRKEGGTGEGVEGGSRTGTGVGTENLTETVSRTASDPGAGSDGPGGAP